MSFFYFFTFLAKKYLGTHGTLYKSKYAEKLRKFAIGWSLLAVHLILLQWLFIAFFLRVPLFWGNLGGRAVYVGCSMKNVLNPLKGFFSPFRCDVAFDSCFVLVGPPGAEDQTQSGTRSSAPVSLLQWSVGAWTKISHKVELCMENNKNLQANDQSSSKHFSKDMWPQGVVKCSSNVPKKQQWVWKLLTENLYLESLFVRRPFCCSLNLQTA